MTDIAVHTEHLTRDFGPVRAVDDLCLEVPAGTVFGFLGPNGVDVGIVLSVRAVSRFQRSRLIER